MLWGRFVNHEGKIGGNISCDLHMEHLNRLVKDAMSHLGANKTPIAILRTGNALGGLKRIVHHLDKLNGIVISGHHTMRSEMEDLLTLVRELSEKSIFRGRYHPCFKKLKSNCMLSSINKDKLNSWMKTHITSALQDLHYLDNV